MTTSEFVSLARKTINDVRVCAQHDPDKTREHCYRSVGEGLCFSLEIVVPGAGAQYTPLPELATEQPHELLARYRGIVVQGLLTLQTGAPDPLSGRGVEIALSGMRAALEHLVPGAGATF